MDRSVCQVTICADPADLGQQAARRFVAIARQAVAERGRFTVCLSGGSTPRGMYATLAVTPIREEVPWRQVDVFWGDERYLPADHPDNHHQMAWELMLSRVPLPLANIHRMRSEATAPELAAEEYETLLRSFFRLERDEMPRFDLILLGMGADGHTASLFPGTVALRETRRLVVANYVPRLGAFRLTLTLPVLNHAAHVKFLVSGAAKADALRAVLESGEGELPARMVRPTHGVVEWLVDVAAARGLRSAARCID